MANYYAAARSNYFTVDDPEALRAALSGLDIELLADDDNDPNRVVLLCTNEGGWPSWRYDEENDEDIEVDLPALVAPHLAEGQVAVLIESGAEKLRYVAGAAIAVNKRGDRVCVSLEDIYDQAKDLGTHIDRI